MFIIFTLIKMIKKEIGESGIKMSDKNNNNPEKKKKQKENANLKPIKMEVKV